VVSDAVKPNREATRYMPRTAVALAAVGALMAVAAVLAVIEPTTMCAQPALALLVLLAVRRYPGELALASLSVTRASRTRRIPKIRRPPSVVLVVPRGGLLLASSLAVRPPPRRTLPAG
jgi:hypothetical protein